MGEKKNQRKKFKHERREDVQKLINNDMTPTDFAKARSIKKSDFLRDRKSNKEKFKEKLSEDKANLNRKEWNLRINASDLASLTSEIQSSKRA